MRMTCLLMCDHNIRVSGLVFSYMAAALLLLSYFLVAKIYFIEFKVLKS